MSPSSAPPVVDNAAARRFEVTVDGHVAVLEYRRRDDRLVLVHTEVPDELEGQGIGSALVRAALDDAIRGDLTLVPQCSFAREWLERHPDDVAKATVDWPTR